MDSFVEQRAVELQAIIIVEQDDGRMYPIVHSEAIPKCLLPIANRELLAYQLDVLAKSGVLECYVVCSPSYQAALQGFLSTYMRSISAKGQAAIGSGSSGMTRQDSSDSNVRMDLNSSSLAEASMSVSIVVTAALASGGSVDGLRAVADRIRGDFIVMGGDVFCKAPLGPLAARHRLKTADVTMLLARAPTDEGTGSEKKPTGAAAGAAAAVPAGKRRLRIDEEEQEWVGFNDDERVLIKTPQSDLESVFTVHKSLLHHGGALSVRGDLMDMGVYIFSKWVLDLISGYTGVQETVPAAGAISASGNNPSSTGSNGDSNASVTGAATAGASAGAAGGGSLSANNIEYSAAHPTAQAKARFVNIRADLIPFLIKRQYQPADKLTKEIPMLKNKFRELGAIEPWLHNTYSNPLGVGNSYDLLDTLSLALYNKGNFGTRLLSDAENSSGKKGSASAAALSGWGSADDLLLNATASTSGRSPPGSPNRAGNSRAAAAANIAAEKKLAIATAAAELDAIRCYGWIYDDVNFPTTSTLTSNEIVGAGTLYEPAIYDGARCVLHTGFGPEQLLPSFVASSLAAIPAFVQQSMLSEAGPAAAGSNTGSTSASGAVVGGPCLMIRLTSLSSYMCLNRDIPLAMWSKQHTPWPRLTGYHKKESSIIGTNGTIADKVTLKGCTLGDNVTVHAKTRVNNTLIFNNCTIGEGCIIQNSVLGLGVVIEQGCNLNEVYVGAGAKVVAGSKIKGESIAPEER